MNKGIKWYHWAMATLLYMAPYLAWGSLLITNPIVKYNHIGKAIAYVVPEDPNERVLAMVFDDHTMAPLASPFNTGTNPIGEIFRADKNPDDYENGPNGIKIRTVGTFRYRQDNTDDIKATTRDTFICVKLPAKSDSTEACYDSYPRSPSVLDVLPRRPSGKQRSSYDAEVLDGQERRSERP